MDDLIRRADAIEAVRLETGKRGLLGRGDILDIIYSLPSAVEVVRCKDCKYWERHPTWTACTYWSADQYEQGSTDADDFCSRGERKNK